MIKFRLNQFSRMYRDPEPGVDGGGVAIEQAAADTSAAPATPDPQSPEAAVEAIFGKSEPVEKLPGETEEAAQARARDEKGRFAQKTAADPNLVDPNAPKKPAEQPKDLTVMPEGLTPKAQERFQALANSNRQLTEQATAAAEIAGSPEAVLPMLQSAAAIQSTFREHGVSREQFTQATDVIGMINRGDLAGAEKVLIDQLRQISLVTGRTPGTVDPLQGFPDLQEQVENLQISPAHAIELARGRTQQNHQQTQQQRQQDQQQREQGETQAFNTGVMAVDRFCKERMTSDLDFAKIEPLLQKQIAGGLLTGIPPAQYRQIVEKTYNLIKETSSINRGPSTGGGVLRPSGSESAKAAPKNAFEAMFGKSAPAGYRE